MFAESRGSKHCRPAVYILWLTALRCQAAQTARYDLDNTAYGRAPMNHRSSIIRGHYLSTTAHALSTTFPFTALQWEVPERDLIDDKCLYSVVNGLAEKHCGHD